MHDTSVPLNSRDALVAVLLTLLVLLTGGYQMVQGVCGVYHDDGIYVSTAQALAEGQGYRLINLPGSPAQSKFPILYPALLAVVWRLWPFSRESAGDARAVPPGRRGDSRAQLLVPYPIWLLPAKRRGRLKRSSWT